MANPMFNHEKANISRKNISTAQSNQKYYFMTSYVMDFFIILLL